MKRNHPREGLVCARRKLRFLWKRISTPPIPGGGRKLAVMGASTSPSNFGWKPPETGALEVEGLRQASNLARYPFSRRLEGKTWSQVAAFLLLLNYFTRRNAPSSHATIHISLLRTDVKIEIGSALKIYTVPVQFWVMVAGLKLCFQKKSARCRENSF